MALKRHPALQDYSREHHDELLLIWKIKEGLRKNISHDRIIAYCMYHYISFTSFHMENEEKFILTKLPESDTDRIKILADHAEIEEMVHELSQDPDNNNKALTEFANKLEKHIRFEERSFFPKLQTAFSDDVIQLMHPAETKRKETELWKDSFWENQ